jgi:catalase
MPLPKDERIVALANDLLQMFDTLFGVHPGFRPAHAKGVLLTGTFRPTAAAAELSTAPHLVRESTPVTVRFSNATGIPLMPDGSPDANPRGMAVRFHLGERVHTDIVAHSTDGFPTRDGAGFLEFLKAVAASGPEVASPKPIEVFLGEHPAALAFVVAPKPFPSSLARQSYFGVTAFVFNDAGGKSTAVRYRIVPEQGEHFVDDGASLSANYHFDEIAERVGKGPVRFKLVVQVAGPNDVTDDATVHWPENREMVELGTIELTALTPDTPAQQQHLIFDPIPRVEGIEPSGDPLLELRAAVYLISGRRRRAAPVAGLVEEPAHSV